MKPTTPTHHINGHTRMCLIIGDPVRHTLSPAMHNAAYAALGLSDAFVYLAAEVARGDLKRTVNGVRSMGIRGLTCTIPHKEDILPYLDDIDDIARQIGAVNTVVQHENRLTGHNTDWIGIVEPLRQHLGTLQHKRVAILGAGGTARAAAFGIRHKGGVPALFNRTLPRAEALGQEIGCEAYPLEQIERLRDFDIILNTTSVGMNPQLEHSPIPKELISSHQIVFDAIYTPFETRLLKDAHAQGARTLRGAQMFLEQGVAQFELYTEHKAPRDAMAAVLRAHFGVTSL